MTMKKIIAIIIAGILLSSLVFFLFIYNDPEFRYFIGTSTGLKDKPVLTDNRIIFPVFGGISGSNKMIWNITYITLKLYYYQSHVFKLKIRDQLSYS